MKHRYESDRMHRLSIVVIIASIVVGLVACYFFLHQINNFLGVQEGFDSDLLLPVVFLAAFIGSRKAINYCIVVIHTMRIMYWIEDMQVSEGDKKYH